MPGSDESIGNGSCFIARMERSTRITGQPPRAAASASFSASGTQLRCSTLPPLSLPTLGQRGLEADLF